MDTRLPPLIPSLVGVMEQTRTFKSLAAREAQKANYGDASYWEYLDRHAEELFAKGVKDALTRTLAEALKGNEGD